ncbi:Gamma-interferon-inducible lysosomal thiol reductase, partial [Stegodyphus mimosarum]
MALGKICFLLTIACILTLIAENTEARAARPVNVTVYYESLCPDSGRFFAEQLQPTYEVIPSYMKVELVPYGNARYKFQGGKYVFTCQHA